MNMEFMQIRFSEILKSKSEKKKIVEIIGLCREIEQIEVMDFDYLEVADSNQVQEEYLPIVFSVVVYINNKYLLRLKGSAFANIKGNIGNIVYTHTQLLGSEL